MWLQISMYKVGAWEYQSVGKKVLWSPGVHPFPCTKPWVHVQSYLWLCVLRQELLVVTPRSPIPRPIQIRRANGWKRGRGNCYIHLQEKKHTHTKKTLFKDYKRQKFGWWRRERVAKSLQKKKRTTSKLLPGPGTCAFTCINQSLQTYGSSCWQAVKLLGWGNRACALHALTE